MLAFFSTFTKEKIINCFARVSYIPFNRACLKSENIRHELGEDTEDTTLKDLVQEYEQAKIELMDEGFNVEGILTQRFQQLPRSEEIVQKKIK